MAAPVVLTEAVASGQAAREALRASHGVRLVDADQEGTSAEHLPDGVFGFTYSPALAAPLFRQFRYRTYEIHRTGGETVIIGFVTPEDAARLREGGAPVEVAVYHDAQGEATVIAGIPYSRIVRHRQYSVRNTPGLLVQVRPG